MKRTIAAALVFSLVVSGCSSNSFSGPRRLVNYAGFDNVSPERGSDGVIGYSTLSCQSAPNLTSVNPVVRFYDAACDSAGSPGDPVKARTMMNAGVTLNMIRCNDFFAQRMSNQTAGRVARQAIPPVSALLTGVLGLLSFETDEGRQEAVQILGLAQTATVAGLEIFESEFLFDSDNVYSVRNLTMDALDAHSAEILSGNAGFYPATRHLVDHQMICTPAGILELVTQAIDRGEITSRTQRRDREARAAFANDRLLLIALAAAVGSDQELSANEIGSMWLLTQGPSATQSAIAQRGLQRLQTEEDGNVVLSPNAIRVIAGLSEELTEHFEETLGDLPDAEEFESMDAGATLPQFTFPDGFSSDVDRRVTVEVADPQSIEQ